MFQDVKADETVDTTSVACLSSWQKKTTKEDDRHTVIILPPYRSSPTRLPEEFRGVLLGRFTTRPSGEVCTGNEAKK